MQQIQISAFAKQNYIMLFMEKLNYQGNRIHQLFICKSKAQARKCISKTENSGMLTQEQQLFESKNILA